LKWYKKYPLVNPGVRRGCLTNFPKEVFTMPTALIIGASRGIGHELVHQYRADGWRVIATVRKQSDYSQLAQMGAEVHLLDVTDQSHCITLARMLDKQNLDIAILNAGIYGPPQNSMHAPSEDDFDAVMHTNVLAAMWLLPRIGALVCAQHGKLAVISSTMGSLSMRTNSIACLYRASKAALNSVLIDIARDLEPQGVRCVALHPGWVRTDMGGANADISVEESVTGIRHTLATLPASSNGTFLNYDGTPLTW
jgi:NAD(P)-dependent dehydrogenase (short-subunit alcohol dehydrogenase family)